MTQWYKNNQRLFRNQKQALDAHHSQLKMEVCAKGFRLNSQRELVAEAVVVHGPFRLEIPGTSRHCDYKVTVVLPRNFPNDPPILFCNDAKLPIGNIDRHILNDGRACLGIPSEVRHRWRNRPDLLSFLDTLVAPFLAWQFYFDQHGCPPPWGQQDHAKDGILEHYTNLLGQPIGKQLYGFIEFLARKNEPKGHEPCPCGSGKKLRHCHRDVVQRARQQACWSDVLADLHCLRNAGDAKSS
jgi:hypothetical protein